MAEVTPAPAKKAAGAVKARKPAGLSVTELLMQAVAASSERGGISLVALKKSLAVSGYDVKKNNSRLKLVLRSLVAKETLLQTKGMGASGSFKLNKKQADPMDKAARKKQQPAGAKKLSGPAKKAKKASAVAGTKKPVKAVKKPASVVAPKPKTKPKSTTKPVRAKAKAKPKAAPKKK